VVPTDPSHDCGEDTGENT